VPSWVLAAELGGSLATLNFGEFHFYVVHEYGKKAEAANAPALS
jgi:hypothetical protein